jgi:hypothetical protein
MFTHLRNFLNLYQKMLMSFVMVNASWKSEKENQKVHMNEAQLENLKTCSLGKEIWKIIQYIYFKKIKLGIRSNFNPSKVHNYHMVKVFWKKCLTHNFIISFLNTYIVIMKKFKWNFIWFKKFLDNLIS